MAPARVATRNRHTDGRRRIAQAHDRWHVPEQVLSQQGWRSDGEQGRTRGDMPQLYK